MSRTDACQCAHGYDVRCDRSITAEDLRCDICRDGCSTVTFAPTGTGLWQVIFRHVSWRQVHDLHGMLESMAK